MSPRFLQRGLTVTLLAIQPACSLFGPEGCDAILRQLLRVTAVDSQTEQPIEGPFTLTVISETSGDSLVLVPPVDAGQPLIVWAFGSGGDYTVDLQREGYQRWRRSEIRVNFDGCGDPKTRSVTAALVRL